MTTENINYLDMLDEFYDLVVKAYEEIQANKKLLKTEAKPKIKSNGLDSLNQSIQDMNLFSRKVW